MALVVPRLGDVVVQGCCPGMSAKGEPGGIVRPPSRWMGSVVLQSAERAKLSIASASPMPPALARRVVSQKYARGLRERVRPITSMHEQRVSAVRGWRREFAEVQADGSDAADRAAFHPQVRRRPRRLQVDHAVLHGHVEIRHGLACGDAEPPVATRTRVAGAADINFALRLQAGVAEVRESGAYQTEVGFSAGDRFQIAVEGGVVWYSKNGVVFHVSARQADYALRAHAVLFDLPASIAGVGLGSVSDGASTPAPAPVSPDPPDAWAPPDTWDPWELQNRRAALTARPGM